jgi:hypothetical protein
MLPNIKFMMPLAQILLYDLNCFEAMKIHEPFS